MILVQENIVTDTIWPPSFTDTRDPKYIVLIQSLRTAVRSGQLEPGYKMPPVRELAWQLGITPGTVARAYKMAVDEGLLESTVGRGTFVAQERLESPIPPESLMTVYQPDDINLRGVRVPDVGQSATIQRILAKQAAEPGHNYTDCPTPLSDYAARQAVVNWIGPDRVGRLKVDDIVLALGAQNGVMIALQSVLHGANPVVVTEELTYPGVRHAGRLLRTQVIGVEMDQDGMRPDRLEDTLRRHGGQVLLTSAEVHSPSTRRTTLRRRQEICEIARRYQLQIIEDDCHCVTRPDEPAYRELCPERAWYVSSLTKSVSAAIRFGFVACPREQAATARQVAQSTFYGLPQPMLNLCTELLNTGEAERIRKQVQAVILRRVQVAVNVLGRWEIEWRPNVPFIWLHLPQGWRGSTFMRACDALGIRIKPADEFALADGHAPNAVRLGINAHIPQHVFEAELQKMSDLLTQPPVGVDI